VRFECDGQAPVVVDDEYEPAIVPKRKALAFPQGSFLCAVLDSMAASDEIVRQMAQCREVCDGSFAFQADMTDPRVWHVTIGGFDNGTANGKSVSRWFSG
jgi:hypothetical protein